MTEFSGSRLALCVALALMGGAAHAQVADNEAAASQDTGKEGTEQEASSDRRLSTVLVTARKRAEGEALQQTPISATALDSKLLVDTGFKDLVDVGRFAPNVSLQPSSQRGVQNFSIRGMGVSGSTPSDEPAVGILQDGVYWGTNYGAIGDMFDVESIEILRGPQGTLFGRNVTGGAVLVRSARPTAEFKAQATAGAGNGGFGEVSGIINGPISGDTLTGRLAVQYRSLDGYYTDSNTNTDYGASDSFLIRPSLKFQPNEDFDVTLITEWYSDEGDPTVARGVYPHTVGGITLPELEGFTSSSDYWTVAPDQRGATDIDVYFGVIDANWRIFGGTLTSITGYRDVKIDVLTDYDGSPSQGFQQGIDQNQDQFSTELRFAKDVSEFLDYTAGIYYFEQNMDFGETRVLNNNSILLATHSLLDNNSFAAFTEVDLNWTDKLTTTLGVRYTEEEKRVRGAPFGACSLDFTVCPLSAESSVSDDNVSPKVGVSYQFTPDQLGFASVTKGFRSGGFSLRGTAIIEPYKAEEVTAYEVGYKGDLMDRHLRLNVSAFYNEYSDLQRTVLGVSESQGVVQSVFNAADATISGLELEVTYLLTNELSLDFVYGYTDAGYDRFDGVTNPGDRSFVRVPENTGSIALSYDKTLGSGATINGRISASYTGSYYFDDPNLLQQDAYTLVDANIAYTAPSGEWTAALYGRNLTNQEYSVWGSSLGALGQNLFPAQPLSWGGRLTVRY